jgi:hypothetical protein
MDSQVRKTAISCLQSEFDEYLASSAFLKTLFQALNDENSEVFKKNFNSRFKSKPFLFLVV